MLFRADAPYCFYDRFKIQVHTGENGDCYDRYMVRMKELHEIFKLIQEIYQELQSLPSGEVMGKVPKVMKPQVGEAYAQTENPKGIMGCLVASDGGTNPFRVHFRRPSFYNITLFDELMVGHKYADLLAILASFDLVFG